METRDFSFLFDLLLLKTGTEESIEDNCSGIRFVATWAMRRSIRRERIRGRHPGNHRPMETSYRHVPEGSMNYMAPVSWTFALPVLICVQHWYRKSNSKSS